MDTIPRQVKSCTDKVLIGLDDIPDDTDELDCGLILQFHNLTTSVTVVITDGDITPLRISGGKRLGLVIPHTLLLSIFPFVFVEGFVSPSEADLREFAFRGNRSTVALHGAHDTGRPNRLTRRERH